MNSSFFEKFNKEKSLMYILIGAISIAFIFIFYLFFFHGIKRIEILSPKGGEELEVGNTYQITWKAKRIEKIGIVLFKEEKAEWIAKDLNARTGKYDWKIYPGQKLGDGYWIAVFEYPWRSGNKVSYSKSAFAITYSKSWSCDNLSIENEWPYVPSDTPNLRSVFITEKGYTGNLGGLEGADKICQEEAGNKGFKGKWHAFLGGDKDDETAIERMKKTSRGIKGIFVEAKPADKLLRGATCHRLLGKNFDAFLIKLSNPLSINEQKIDKEFLENLSNIWLGRIDNKSKKNCVPIYSIASNPYASLVEKYSFTATCQNWTQNNKFVEGYPVPINQPKPSFPNCYTSTGRFTDAVALGGLSSGLINSSQEGNMMTPYQGKPCGMKQKLICVEE